MANSNPTTPPTLPAELVTPTLAHLDFNKEGGSSTFFEPSRMACPGLDFEGPEATKIFANLWKSIKIYEVL